jgi:hypothetical protein
MEADPDKVELDRLYWEMNLESQQALVQCARLLVRNPEALRQHLIHHFALLSRFLPEARERWPGNDLRSLS